MCAVCGTVDAASRISQSRFVCTGFGHEANADTNVAINILRRADWCPSATRDPLIGFDAIKAYRHIS